MSEQAVGSGGTPPGPVSGGGETGNFWSSFLTAATQKVTEIAKEVENSPALHDAMQAGKELASKAQLETQSVLNKVKEAFDPMQGLRGTEMKVIVTSLQPSKVMAVQAAVSTVFPVSEMSVSGAKVDSGVANQPVGFAAGQKGAESRIVNLRLMGAEQLDGAIVISIESFIAEIEGNWYDMACVVLHDEEQGMSLVSFSQAVRVPTHYVDEARAATSAGYARKDTGLEVTVGEMVHKAVPHISADDWQGNATNGHLKRQQLLETCVVAVMGEYLVERRKRRGASKPAT